MHEASIALSVLDVVIGQCRRQGYRSISMVRLRIGKAAGILPEALIFAFDIAKSGTTASQADLLIEVEPVGGQCRTCGRTFTSEERFIFACPVCDSKEIRVDQGQAMQILDMEVDD